MHPLFKLMATRPQLLAEHATAYGELLATELPRASSVWKRRSLLYGLASVGLMVALLLGGVALMLWAALPLSSMPMPWILIAVPLIPAIAGIACLVAARATAKGDLLGDLRQQFSADLAVLQEAGLAR